MERSKVSRITRTAIVTAVAVSTIAGTAHGAGEGDRSRYVKRTGNGPDRVVLVCQGWAEDSASSWDMVQTPAGYGDGRLTLKCSGTEDR